MFHFSFFLDKLDLCLLYGFNDLFRVLKFKGFFAIMDTGPVLFSFLALFCLGFFCSFLFTGSVWMLGELWMRKQMKNGSLCILLLR
jgi:hypothetical protein